MWQKIEYKETFLDEMLQMTIENYGEEEHISNKEFILHEYFENPSGKPTISLAYDEENNKLAGQYVVIAQRVFIAGEEYPAILSLNTLTRKEYRGQKVFVKLAEEAYSRNIEKGTYFCYGAPNQNSHHGFVTKLGFVDIGIMPLYLKIVNPFTLVVDKLGFHKKEKRIVNSQSMTTDKHIINIDKNNIFLMQRFWDKVKGKYPVMVVRDESFIKWRYIDMPLRDYNIYGYVENDELKGYVITRVTEVANMQCGMIVDLLIETGRKNVGDILIKHAQKVMTKQNVGLMGCLMQKHFEECDSLKRNMFFKCPRFLEPQPFPIIYRKFTEHSSDEVLEDFNNWYFTMGDYDVI